MSMPLAGAAQGNLVARLRGNRRGKPILLLAHIDVVRPAARLSDRAVQAGRADGYLLCGAAR